MNKKQYIQTIFERLKEKNPTPESDLDYTNHYTFVVAVVLSAQSTDKGVNKAMAPLFEFIKTPQDLLALGIEKFKEHIKTIGLYNNKAKNIFALSHMLIDKFNSTIPDDRKLLENLPGVGRKSANVILNVCFNQPTIGVDTHIFRVSHRLNLSKANKPELVEKDLLKIIPKKFIYKASHWLVLHGRYTCLAKKPKCHACLINDICPSINL